MSLDPKPALLTLADIVRYKREYDADVQLLEELPQRIKLRKRMYEAALLFAPHGFSPDQIEDEELITMPSAGVREPIGPGPSGPLQAESPKLQNHDFELPDLVTSRENVQKKNAKKGKLTWVGGLLQLLNNIDHGITHQDALEQLSATGLPASLGHKGFYNAIARLEKRSQLVKRGGLLYAPSVVKAIEDRGEKVPVAEARHRPGGSASLVMQVLREHRDGLDGNQLRSLAGAMSDAPESMIKHSQYIYTVLATLIGQGKVEKNDQGLYRVKGQ